MSNSATSKLPFSLSETELETLRKNTEIFEMPAKTKLITAGMPVRYLYFVESGCVRGYRYHEGKLLVEYLSGESDFFTDAKVFFSGGVSSHDFETITDCRLRKISLELLETIKLTDPRWETTIARLSSQHLECKMERVRDFQTLTAKERYLKFLERSPDLAQSASVETVASYLGMEPQSLSRIRRQISS
ncbi:hypothetical protein FUAX_01570 [Fulvitalea axinellae]|uniref:Cyclic nucleotide-binding domain-containing protein n=1 Tax=Fulvitalea axinellae TaxID=1182444 RepID=A0AAU9D6C6_9BACT|nr:hypothetical protein FUAX_01570 [Fulvitalea axinellae]